VISRLLQPLLSLHGWQAYLLVGLLVFAEDAVMLGFVFPGETAAILGGVLASRGGVSLTGSGGGDFGSRWGWYVDIVRRKVSENWLKYEVDPNVQGAQRVFLTFEISRAGQPGNIQIEQSSGVPSLDISAKRALERIDTFGPLPNDYTGSRVSVELWFDYRH